MSASRRCNWAVICAFLLTMVNVTWWQYGEQYRGTVPTVLRVDAHDLPEKVTANAAVFQPVSIPAIDFKLFRKGSQPDPYLPLFAGLVLQARGTMREPATDYGKLREGYKVPQILNSHHLDCRAIIRGDTPEHQRAQNFMKQHTKVPLAEWHYSHMLQDCEQFKSNRGYVQVPLTKEEEEYPLAFSISVNKHIEHVERLLRALYQPQNVYCLHVNPAAPLRLHLALNSLVSCFPNVFISSRLNEPVFFDASELLPTLNCMKDLVNNHRGRWKYLINFEESEFPLRSNWEMVQISKIFNGSNDIGGSKYRMDTKRIHFTWKRRFSNSAQRYITYNSATLRRDPLPTNVTFYRGDTYGMFTHNMVRYLVQSSAARGLLQWCAYAGAPAEYFWNTLNYNAHLKAPGGYEGPDDVAHQYSYNQISRVKHWVGVNYEERPGCFGFEDKIDDVALCVFGVGDLPWLASRPELAAHRFNLTSQHVAYDCIEELHRNRTILKDRVDFDAQFYETLPILPYTRKDGL